MNAIKSASNSSMGTCQAARQSQVSAQFEELELVIEELNNRTNNLAERLEGVLCKQPAGSEKDQCPKPMLAPLANRLVNNSDKVRAIIRTVDELLRTLEL